MMVHINFAALLYKYLIISYLKLGLTFLRYLRKWEMASGTCGEHASTGHGKGQQPWGHPHMQGQRMETRGPSWHPLSLLMYRFQSVGLLLSPVFLPFRQLLKSIPVFWHGSFRDSLDANNFFEKCLLPHNQNSNLILSINFGEIVANLVFFLEIQASYTLLKKILKEKWRKHSH